MFYIVTFIDDVNYLILIESKISYKIKGPFDYLYFSYLFLKMFYLLMTSTFFEVLLVHVLFEPHFLNRRVDEDT